MGGKMSDKLEIKVSRIHKLNGNSQVKAFADICVNDSLLIKGLRIVDGKKGLFVSMPQEKASNNRWFDSVLPLDKETRAEIVNAVLSSYNQ
jgi:stage V sporulation protein G